LVPLPRQTEEVISSVASAIAYDKAITSPVGVSFMSLFSASGAAPVAEDVLFFDVDYWHQATTGWEVKISLREGLTRTIRWISEHLDQYDPDAYRT